MSGPNERDEVDGLVRLLARHVLTHVTPEHCTADCMARAILASDWLAERDRRTAAKTLREAADEAHREARWIAEQVMRGQRPDPLDRMTVLEQVIRDRADRIERDE